MAVALDGSARTEEEEEEEEDSCNFLSFAVKWGSCSVEPRPALTRCPVQFLTAPVRQPLPVHRWEVLQCGASVEAGSAPQPRRSGPASPCKLNETFLKLLWKSKGGSRGRRKRWPPDCWGHRFSFHALSTLTQLFPHPFWKKCPSSRDLQFGEAVCSTGTGAHYSHIPDMGKERQLETMLRGATDGVSHNRGAWKLSISGSRRALSPHLYLNLQNQHSALIVKGNKVQSLIIEENHRIV